MKNKINKNKILKYRGALLLATALGVGSILMVSEAATDHTKELCPITKFAHFVGAVDANGFNHQLLAMENDAIKNEVNDFSIKFDNDYEKISQEKSTVLPSVIVREDGSKEYLLPDGYVVRGGVGVKESQIVTHSEGYLFEDYDKNEETFLKTR